MKTIQILAIVLLSSLAQAVRAQKIIESQAFDKMIRNDITYAISGESTPITGIKLDISKPEGTLSGMFPIKNKKLLFDLVSFEFKGGVTDKSFSLLKGNFVANSAFEFKPSFHFFFWGSALYGAKSENRDKVAIVKVKNALAEAEINRILDTAYVVTLLYNHHLEVLGKPKPVPGKVKGSLADHQGIAAALIPIIMNAPKMVILPGATLQTTLANLPQAKIDISYRLDPAYIADQVDRIVTSSYYDKVVTLYKKYEKRLPNLPEEELDMQIINASGVWTQKRYYWLSLSPVLRTDKANEYHTKFGALDSLYFKPGFRWSYGGSATLNRYWVTPGKSAVLARGTLALLKTNNLNNLTPFNYETRTPFFQYGSAVTQKSKTGAAYNNSDITSGIETKFTLEFYYLPLKTFSPGLYLAADVAGSELYKLPTVIARADDTFRAGVEGGVVFNINNREKDKSLLSVIPYFRYEDLTDKVRTPIKTGIAETQKDFQDRNMFFGIKVAVPINLPKLNN